MDGANVEIAELVGDENIYIFGEGRDIIDLYAKSAYKSNPEFYAREAIKPLVDFIVSDAVLAMVKKNAERLHNELINKDFGSWLFLTWKTTSKWRKCFALTTKIVTHGWIKWSRQHCKSSGFFSSDRTIAQLQRRYLALELICL